MGGPISCSIIAEKWSLNRVVRAFELWCLLPDGSREKREDWGEDGP